MKDLILIVDQEKYQFDTKEDLMQNLLGDKENNYNEMKKEEEEKKERRYLKAYINLQGQKEYIIDFKEEVKKNPNIPINERFLIDNDDMYVMSLLRMNQVVLLENTKSDIFSKEINKEGIDDNYLILNSLKIFYANEITNNYGKKIIKSLEEMKDNQETENKNFDR